MDAERHPPNGADSRTSTAATAPSRCVVERLATKGLKVINLDQLKELHDCKVLIRAHGEPPETYQIALKNNIELIDASCPVVLKLQHRVRTSFDLSETLRQATLLLG